MDEVTCPVCNEYEGSPRAVESHISGRQDDAHYGKVGRQYRDRLLGAAGETVEKAGEFVPVGGRFVVPEGGEPDEERSDEEPTEGGGEFVVPDEENLPVPADDEEKEGNGLVWVICAVVAAYVVSVVAQILARGGGGASKPAGGRSGWEEW